MFCSSSHTNTPSVPRPTSSSTSYFQELGLDTGVMNALFSSPLQYEEEEEIAMDEFDDDYDSILSMTFDSSSREATGTPPPEMHAYCSSTVPFLPQCQETTSEPMYNPLSALVSCRMFGLGGEMIEEQKPTRGDEQEDEEPQERQRLKGKLAHRGEAHCMVENDAIRACATRALKVLDVLKTKHNEHHQEEEHIRQDKEPRNLETEAQRAFQSPSAMAARRLGQRGLLFQKNHNKSTLPSATGRGGSSDGTATLVTTTVPRRRIQTRRRAPDPTLFLQMNSVLQVRGSPKASNNATHGNGEEEREEGSDEELAQKLREEHEERVFQVRVNSMAALHLSCLLQPYVRQYLALLRCRRPRHAARIIQEQYRRYRQIREQRRIQCERLRKSAARASWANLKQHREQHDTMTLLERRHVASKVIGRAVLRHCTHNVTMRQIAFEREREQAEECFRRGRYDWAATLIAQSWLTYKENCRQRFESSLRLIRNCAARVIQHAMTDHYLKATAKRRELEDWVLQQTDKATPIDQRQLEREFQAPQRAAARCCGGRNRIHKDFFLLLFNLLTSADFLFQRRSLSLVLCSFVLGCLFFHFPHQFVEAVPQLNES